MVKLLHCIPCEKVIVSLEQTSSLIGILEALNIELPESAPPRVMFPMKWSVSVLYHRTVDVQHPIDYEVKIIVRDAGKEPAIESLADFTVNNENVNFRTVFELYGMPVFTSGFVDIELYLRPANQQKWKKEFICPLYVNRGPHPGKIIVKMKKP